MSLIQYLKNEHNKILLSLRILQEICEKHQNIEDIEKIFTYLNYIEKRHSQKEVTLILHAMYEKKEKDNPFAKLLEEHNENKQYLKELAGWVKKHKITLPQLSQLYISIKSYIGFISRHIEKEDTIFYPLAEKMIPKEKYPEILNEFELIDLETGAKNIKKSDGMLETLKTKYIQTYE